VRVRTAQLGERSHSTEGRLTYLEEQVTKIRSKMKQIRVRLTVRLTRITQKPWLNDVPGGAGHQDPLRDDAQLSAPPDPERDHSTTSLWRTWFSILVLSMHVLKKCVHSNVWGKSSS